MRLPQDVGPIPKVTYRIGEDGLPPFIGGGVAVVSDSAELSGPDVVTFFGAIQQKMEPAPFCRSRSLRSTLGRWSGIVNLAELSEVVEVLADYVLADDAVANDSEELVWSRDAQSGKAACDLGD